MGPHGPSVPFALSPRQAPPGFTGDSKPHLEGGQHVLGALMRGAAPRGHDIAQNELVVGVAAGQASGDNQLVSLRSMRRKRLDWAVWHQAAISHSTAGVQAGSTAEAAVD